MLRIRVDDVLVKNSSFVGSPQKRFKQISRWLEQSNHIIHVPTILVKDIQHYPDTVEFIKIKITENKMFPELHGWDHVDYNKLDEKSIHEHLDKSMNWFNDTLKFLPKVWATPWGAESEKLTKLASQYNLIVEGTGQCIEPAHWLRLAREHNVLRTDITVMEHWWNRGLRLLRIAHVMNYGSYETARQHEEIF